jgi:hypothetical protein
MSRMVRCLSCSQLPAAGVCGGDGTRAPVSLVEHSRP